MLKAREKMSSSEWGLRIDCSAFFFFFFNSWVQKPGGAERRAEGRMVDLSRLQPTNMCQKDAENQIGFPVWPELS